MTVKPVRHNEQNSKPSVQKYMDKKAQKVTFTQEELQKAIELRAEILSKAGKGTYTELVEDLTQQATDTQFLQDIDIIEDYRYSREVKNRDRYVQNRVRGAKKAFHAQKEPTQYERWRIGAYHIAEQNRKRYKNPEEQKAQIKDQAEFLIGRAASKLETRQVLEDAYKDYCKQKSQNKKRLRAAHRANPGKRPPKEYE
ncbi:MAG: hypothetical protein ILP11_04675 [Alphaproteobacteria bacterium]|nr:hypothetical protein [Alphaproteobacteria bacterium]